MTVDVDHDSNVNIVDVPVNLDHDPEFYRNNAYD